MNQNSPNSFPSNINITFYGIISSQNPFNNPQACTRIKLQPCLLYDKCIISHICPMPRSRPTRQFSSSNAHKGTHSHPTIELSSYIYISSTFSLEIMSFQDCSKTPLILHLHQQPSLITRTLLLQCGKKSEIRVYTTSILLINIRWMHTTM